MLEAPPEHAFSISVPVGGYVKTTSLIPGAHVHKGEVLLTLEGPQYIDLQQQYLTAKARLQMLNAEYDRQAKLNATKAVSDKDFQQALANLESQRVATKALAEQLRLISIDPDKLTENNMSRTITLRSPANAYVVKVNINTGKYVSSSDVLLELVDPSELHLTLNIFEDDAPRIKPDQRITCYTNSDPGKIYTATVHFLTPSILQERYTEVHCHLETPYKDLMPGMYMNAIVELDSVHAQCLPEESIVKWNNSNYIFVNTGANKYKMVPVHTGTTTEGYTAITDKLPQEGIVIKNAYTLLMKLKNSGEEE